MKATGTKDAIKGLLKSFWYGLFFTYHLRKGNRIGTHRKTVAMYHMDMMRHYYFKAHGREYNEKNNA